jgi:hypothetical protein
MAEKLTTEEVLQDLGRTNINNIKHIKNLNTNKHLNTFNDFTPSDNHQMDNSVLVASPQAEPVGEALASIGNPPPWRFIKADLFDNATTQQLAKNKRKFNLKLAFLLKDKSEYQYLGAALNTPMRNVKRGFDFSDPNQLNHYNILERVYQTMSTAGLDRVRASKCYEPAKKGKGATIFGTSVVIGQDLETSEYLVALIINDRVYDLMLNGKTLSDAQRNANCIASTQQGDMIRPRKTANDFFGDSK